MTTIVVIIAIVILLALLLAWALCRAAAGRLTIDQGEAFGGDYDADRN